MKRPEKSRESKRFQRAKERENYGHELEEVVSYYNKSAFCYSNRHRQSWQKLNLFVCLLLD